MVPRYGTQSDFCIYLPRYYQRLFRRKFEILPLKVYTLKVTTDFAAAHSLRDYAGDCRRLHGHNWKVEVEITTTVLDRCGMGIDFKLIKKATQSVVRELDHHYLNEVPPFDNVNPTAENIAAYLFQGISRILSDGRIQVSAVTLWETERACVRYQENNTS
uniref:6-carboxy-5,6,7,8-tetrahydropterin synthase n=1 Tax=Candidatus Kentrum sp. FM TaxID=2126340 RepID=A0A450WSS1_9GAMM|nr:MAG: 6-pyruvoyltetrahydropterin/6-carboxytetrahydropterin synthase [Candidatus Kentron sp. FM]VFJ75541.1 MAG: 6-pyruvoyltetrahydropterin/6-carboxytetrahydropterin synthase [Candidatus Kentron sp. FM]VFK20095.1 MAG: 6-pyruvoyltetrahydropterin/6-carboxytetrahydropterin synthase [Candidatus Kentron sp. FM]